MKKYPIVLYVSKCRALTVLARRKYLAHSIAIGYKGLVYCFIILTSFLVGLTPVLFNFVVDPYNVNRVFNLQMNKEKISLKAHYPLWKISNYPKEQAKTLILGDSRALALKDKYWHQLKMSDAYNFAYGGATLHEVIDTVSFIKTSPKINTLIIGIQLRSFSPLFKKGLNRVPEAIKLINEPVSYYANGFVTEISWRQIEQRYESEVMWLKDLVTKVNVNLISTAHANDVSIKTEKTLEKLLDPRNCTSCILPKLIASQPAPIQKIMLPKHALGLGLWTELWPPIILNRQLPKTFAKQIAKNAQSDWQSFSFSQQYWQGLVSIADWANSHDVKLIFFIPPTIAEMQQQITNYGYAKANQKLRLDLARLAPVIDFDFDSALTRNLDNFNDAYHFNYKVAKMIIGELIQFISSSAESKKMAYKRRSQITCPITPQETLRELASTDIVMREGSACRIWHKRHE